MKIRLIYSPHFVKVGLRLIRVALTSLAGQLHIENLLHVHKHLSSLETEESVIVDQSTAVELDIISWTSTLWCSDLNCELLAELARTIKEAIKVAAARRAVVHQKRSHVVPIDMVWRARLGCQVY